MKLALTSVSISFHFYFDFLSFFIIISSNHHVTIICIFPLCYVSPAVYVLLLCTYLYHVRNGSVHIVVNGLCACRLAPNSTISYMAIVCDCDKYVRRLPQPPYHVVFHGPFGRKRDGRLSFCFFCHHKLPNGDSDGVFEQDPSQDPSVSTVGTWCAFFFFILGMGGSSGGCQELSGSQCVSVRGCIVVTYFFIISHHIYDSIVYCRCC